MNKSIASGLAQMGQPTRANAAAVMCPRCQELDWKVARYRLIMARVMDDQLAAGITQLIEEAEVEKAELHRQQQK